MTKEEYEKLPEKQKKYSRLYFPEGITQHGTYVHH